MVVLEALGGSLREAFFMFWETLWALVLGFGLSGAVQAFVSRRQMQRVLGRPGAASVVKATALGAASSSCSYAAAAMAKSLFAKGADFVAAIVFMVASTNLVVELGIVLAILIGWQFTASEFLGGVVMIGLFAVLARFVFPSSMVDAARRRLQGHAGDDEPEPDGMASMDVESQLPARPRVRSLAGWSDAASYTLADMTMLRKEMLIGFTVAGFLTELVPDSAWQALFITGHGFWSSLENVFLGPLVAIISFVCSIGNVPLAAALWKGGISFGGVASCIFADLITLPLLLIYRRYYGWALTLRMLAVLWLVMAVGGLIVEGIFEAFHAVPQSRPTQIAGDSIGVNVTTILDLVSLVVLAGLSYLAHNRERFGGGAGYALDPVCGMQVERASTPARARHADTTVFFCSDRCQARFTADPARFTRQDVAAATVEEADLNGPVVTDPVCGMSVDPALAAARREVDGTFYWFCSAGCAEAFDRDAASVALDAS